MSNENNNKNKKTIFEKIPRVTRVKKSVLLTVIAIASILALIIISYLPKNNVQSTSEDTLENEVENTHWLTSSTINKPQKKEEETQQRVEENSSEQQYENPLVIKKNQEEQLREALDKINHPKGNNVETNFENLDKKESTPNNAPITVALTNAMSNQIEDKRDSSLGSFAGNTLPAGSFIPIIFLTELNSELSGYTLVEVTHNVYSINRSLIIPQGSKILLQYDSADTESERLACRSTYLILPNGKTLSINEFPVVDLFGRTGLRDKADHHYIKNFFSVVGNIATNQASTLAASQLSQIKHAENISPLLLNSPSNYLSLKKTTFSIRAGFEGNLLVTHDVVIPD